MFGLCASIAHGYNRHLLHTRGKDGRGVPGRVCAQNDRYPSPPLTWPDPPPAPGSLTPIPDLQPPPTTKPRFDQVPVDGCVPASVADPTSDTQWCQDLVVESKKKKQACSETVGQVCLTLLAQVDSDEHNASLSLAQPSYAVKVQVLLDESQGYVLTRTDLQVNKAPDPLPCPATASGNDHNDDDDYDNWGKRGPDKSIRSHHKRISNFTYYTDLTGDLWNVSSCSGLLSQPTSVDLWLSVRVDMRRCPRRSNGMGKRGDIDDDDDGSLWGPGKRTQCIKSHKVTAWAGDLPLGRGNPRRVLPFRLTCLPSTAEPTAEPTGKPTTYSPLG